MSGEAAPMVTALDAFARAYFAMVDFVRCAQADAYRVLGLGPRECAYRVLASGPHWRLRDYGEDDGSPSLLVVAAPIKRPYIWDLCPSASAIGLCLRQHVHVHLLEWLPATRSTGNGGLDEYASAIRDCVGRIAEKSAMKPFLVGHSLGGTLAAIFATLAPDSIRGLILLAAPLCFQPTTSQFRDALVSLVPPGLSEAEPFPGSLLSQMSALASPDTFVWSRLMDAALSVGDHDAMEMHARVRALGARRASSSWQAGPPDHRMALSRRPPVQRGLDGRTRGRPPLEPVSSGACRCEHSRRSRARRVGRAFPRCDPDNGCADHQAPRRGRGLPAAPRNPDRSRGARARVA